MSGGIVCILRSPYVRTSAHCDRCGRRRPCSGTHGMWTGTDLTCLACGESWCDEGPYPSPTSYRERVERILRALDRWAQATPLRQEEQRQEREWDEGMEEDR